MVPGLPENDQASAGSTAWRLVLAALGTGADERDARREGLLFYVIVLAVLASLAAHALGTSPRLGTAPTRVAFSVLMLLHAWLHWRSPVLAMAPRLTLPYLAAQGLLALGLVLIAWSPALAFGLFPVLIGVSAGTVRDRRVGVAAAVAYLLLGAVSMSWLVGWRDLAQDVPILALTGLFAVFFALAYRRQVDARVEVQSLLGRLSEAHQRLAEYALRVEGLTLAAERQRMARELHDTLAQGVAGLILQIEAAAGQLAEARTERTAAILQHALARARETLSEARLAIGGLRQAVSGDLVVALRSEAEVFTRQSGLACALELRPLPELAGDVCEQARRIVAEALGNVARHARARAATLSCECREGRIVVAVADDGLGFDVAAAPRDRGHYGMLGMRERASLIGGSLRIDSAEGRGTRVELQLPQSQATVQGPSRGTYAGD